MRSSPARSPPRRGKRRLPLTPRPRSRPLRPRGKDQNQHRHPHLLPPPPPQLPTSASRARKPRPLRVAARARRPRDRGGLRACALRACALPALPAHGSGPFRGPQRFDRCQRVGPGRAPGRSSRYRQEPVLQPGVGSREG